MLNSKGNLKQKKTKPAGQECSTVILGLSVTTMEKIKEESKTFSYILDTAERIVKDVKINEDYVVIKAYDNEEKDIKKLKEKDAKKDKSVKDEKGE